MPASVHGGDVRCQEAARNRRAITMYVLIVYDVEVARVTKIHKFLKRHLHWVQNSVFEGELTDAQIETVKAGLQRLLVNEIDSVLLYTARDRRWLSREIIGQERGETGNLV